MIKKTIPNLIQMAVFCVLALWGVACDRVNPAITPSFSGNIEFSASSNTIDIGGGSTLTWAISDPQGALENARLSTGKDDGSGSLNSYVSLTGSKGVAPTYSTTYYLEAIDKDGRVVKTAQVKIRVYGADGQESLDPGDDVAPTETSCDDGIDNDNDELIDCYDVDDCGQVDVCKDTSGNDLGEFTVGPDFENTNPKKEGFICAGDEVTITWESTFEAVEIYNHYNSTSEEFFEENAVVGIKVITIPDYETIVELEFTGKNSGLESEPVMLEIYSDSKADCADPKFNGALSIYVYPSTNLVPGEPYKIFWGSNNLTYLEMNGDPFSLSLHENSAEVRYASSSQTYSFDVRDEQGLSPETRYRKSVSVDRFELKKNAGIFEDNHPENRVNRVVNTKEKGEAYILTNDKVIKSTDYFNAFEVAFDGSQISETENGEKEGGIQAYAKNSDGVQIVAYKYFAYLITADGEVKKLLSNKNMGNSESATFNLVVPQANGQFLIGTSKFMYKIYDGSCEEKISESEMCCYLSDVFSGYVGDCDSGNEIDTGISYNSYFAKPGTSKSFVVTSQGIYQSYDEGQHFTQISDETGLVGGSWLENDVYFWSNSSVYSYEDSRLQRVSLPGTAGGSIHYATEAGGRLFVATANGLFVNNEIGWSRTTDPVVTGQVMHFFLRRDTTISMGGNSYKIDAVSEMGETAHASYGERLMTVHDVQDSMTFSAPSLHVDYRRSF